MTRRLRIRIPGPGNINDQRTDAAGPDAGPGDALPRGFVIRRERAARPRTETEVVSRLTLGKLSVDHHSMANLEFAYAAPCPAPLPPSLTKALPRRGWKVSSCRLDAIGQLAAPPDFMWVNFGKAPKLAFAEEIGRAHV